MEPAPLLELRPEPDHVEKRLFSRPLTARAGAGGKLGAGTGVRTDRTERAKGARPVGVLRAETEIIGHDARGRRFHATHYLVVVGGDVAQLAAAHVKQDQAWVATSGKQTPSRGEAVDAHLQRVRLDQRGVEGRIRLEIDQGDSPVDLANAVDHSPYSCAADRHVEA